MIDVPYITPKEYLELTQKYAILNQKPLIYELIDTENSKFKTCLLSFITKCLDYNFTNRPSAAELKNSFIELEENILYEASITEVNIFKKTIKDNEYSSNKYKFYDNIKKGIYQKEKVSEEDSRREDNFLFDDSDYKNNVERTRSNLTQRTASDLKFFTQTNITTSNYTTNLNQEISKKGHLSEHSTKNLHNTQRSSKPPNLLWKNKGEPSSKKEVVENEYEILANSNIITFILK